MESLKATTNVLHKRAAPYLLVALLGTLPATPALAETVFDDLIVTGQACVGAACKGDAFFPFDPLRIHGPEPVLSMVDGFHDWSIGITDDSMGGPSEFFVAERETGKQVLRMDLDGAVALGVGAALVPNAVSVGRGGSVANQRRVTHVADAEEPTDAVNMRQFEAFQEDALESIGTSPGKLDQDLQAINDRIDGLVERIDRLARKVQ